MKSPVGAVTVSEAAEALHGELDLRVFENMSKPELILRGSAGPFYIV